MREANGLAMSSRNLRLSAEAKTQAAAIYHALTHIKDNVGKTTPENLKREVVAIIERAGFNKIDYLDICNAEDLAPSVNDKLFDHNVALTAAFIEGVRLIDNLVID